MAYRPRLYEHEIVLKGRLRTVRIPWRDIASFTTRAYATRGIGTTPTYINPSDTRWVLTRRGKLYELGGLFVTDEMMHELNLAVDEAHIKGKVDMARFADRRWDYMVEANVVLPRPRGRSPYSK
ncbi:MAG: hypothetical protein ACRDKT_09965 [Actinomycetota bacterium]